MTLLRPCFTSIKTMNQYCLAVRAGIGCLLLVPSLLLLLSGLVYSAGSGFCEGELRRAALLREKIEERWPIRRDGVAVYAAKIGRKLAERSFAARSYDTTFTVIRDHSVKAFAIGGGFFYVSDGAILFSRNESEFAAILAHEIGHELAGHFCDQFQAPSLAGDLLSFFYQGWRQQNGSGRISQEIDPAKEREADRVALSLLGKAGYDPHAILDLARHLHDDTHLGDATRIRSLDVLLRNTPRRPSPESQAFKQIQKRLEAEMNQKNF